MIAPETEVDGYVLAGRLSMVELESLFLQVQSVFQAVHEQKNDVLQVRRTEPLGIACSLDA